MISCSLIHHCGSTCKWLSLSHCYVIYNSNNLYDLAVITLFYGVTGIVIQWHTITVGRNFSKI